jgi:hypothetical protein
MDTGLLEDLSCASSSLRAYGSVKRPDNQGGEWPSPELIPQGMVLQVALVACITKHSVGNETSDQKPKT